MSLIVLLLSLMLVPNPSVSLSEQTSNLNTGPYVDGVVYKMIYTQDHTVLALLSGAIDMSLGYIDPSYYSTLDKDPNIDIYSYLSNGYGHISINCAKYPLNISGFRRAFAYAFDKTAITDIMENHSIEHDSLVPQANTWCAESDFTWHYYTNQSNIGNQILDSLNFNIDPETGYRLAPDGSAFKIYLDYPY
ncbi:MAG: ABC transporter substrate-binding protein, partial [Candidatus Thorarchaeota archaeon]